MSWITNLFGKGRTKMQQAVASLSANVPQKLKITSGAFPASDPPGSLISFQLTATGGTPPYTWSVDSGAMPQGLSLDAASGLISGTVGEPVFGDGGTVQGDGSETYTWTVKVVDSGV